MLGCQSFRLTFGFTPYPLKQPCEQYCPRFSYLSSKDEVLRQGLIQGHPDEETRVQAGTLGMPLYHDCLPFHIHYSLTRNIGKAGFQGRKMPISGPKDLPEFPGRHKPRDRMM